MVYVDEIRNYGWKAGPSCHMYTDGLLSELFEFAARAGIGKSYFHHSKNFPHFDLTVKNRNKAIAAGALESTSRHAVSIRRKYASL